MDVKLIQRNLVYASATVKLYEDSDIEVKGLKLEEMNKFTYTALSKLKLLKGAYSFGFLLCLFIRVPHILNVLA